MIILLDLTFNEIIVIKIKLQKFFISCIIFSNLHLENEFILEKSNMKNVFLRMILRHNRYVT